MEQLPRRRQALLHGDGGRECEWPAEQRNIVRSSATQNKWRRCCVCWLLQGEIRATGFNNEVDKFFGLIEVGKVKFIDHTHK